MTSLLKVLMLVENNGYPRDFRVRREAQALRDAGHQVSVSPAKAAKQGQEVHEACTCSVPAPPAGAVPGLALEFGFATLCDVVLSCGCWHARGGRSEAANHRTVVLGRRRVTLLGHRFVFDQQDLAARLLPRA